jgi:hypothetical protein
MLRAPAGAIPMGDRVTTIGIAVLAITLAMVIAAAVSIWPLS